jgi:Sec-independent protein translocase protein TatA
MYYENFEWYEWIVLAVVVVVIYFLGAKLNKAAYRKRWDK